jgi:hypothetical protein
MSQFILFIQYITTGSQDSSDSIVMGYGLNSCGLIPCRGKIFPPPQHLDWLLGPPSLLSNGYWGSLPRGKEARP